MAIPDERERLTADEDKAADYQEKLNEASLDSVRDRLKPESHPDFDGTHCVECEEEIHPDRLKSGRVYCTHCQTKREFIQKLYR